MTSRYASRRSDRKRAALDSFLSEARRYLQYGRAWNVIGGAGLRCAIAIANQRAPAVKDVGLMAACEDVGAGL